MPQASRIRMNSEALQQAFPDVYREFFSKCSTVVSAPGSFFWSAGLAVIYGGVGALEKLPIRAYVGIERDGHKTLRFGDYLAFIPHQQQFESVTHHKLFEAKFLKVLNELRKTLPTPVGGKIHILSEVPRGSGLNQSGAVNMALSVLLGLESGFVTPQKVAELVIAKTPNVQTDSTFDRLFRFAWKLEANAHVDIGSGSAPFAAFFESTSPFLFFSERRQGSYSNHPYARQPSDVEGHYEVFDTMLYAGYRLKDLFGWRSDPVWPIEFGQIYLGQQKYSSVLLRPMRAVKVSLDQLEHFVEAAFPKFPNTIEPITPSFYYMTQANDRHGFWEKCVNFLLILSTKAVSDIRRLLEDGTADALDEFCNTVMLQERIYEFFTKDLPWSGERDTLAKIKRVMAEKANNGLRSIRFLPDRPDGGGDLLFVAPQGYLEDHVEEFQTVLRTHVSPLVRLDHASWLDGEESGGIRIEQDITRNCYSAFITHGTFSVLEWKRERAPIYRVYSVEAFEKVKAQADLLLDSLEHKILVKGKPLTSDDIKSARATIEILKILLRRLGEDVRAIELPPSAYVERNEMQSKIISPLVTTFKRLTGKRLPLSLRGGLRKNFSVKLDPSDVTIALLDQSR